MKLFQHNHQKFLKQNGKVKWIAPSNLALVKYWGKKDIQLPCNPSLSFVLKNAVTTMEVDYEVSSQFELKFTFEGKTNEKFQNKFERMLKELSQFAPFLNQLKLKINSSNSFPHSAGIASSASAFASLSLCILTIEKELFGIDNTDFMTRASYLARLGSGSACRSLYGGYSVWGELKEVEGSSNEFAISYPFEIHSDFSELRDTMILIDKTEKTVSSSQGHLLMNEHPFRNERFDMARKNLKDLMKVLKLGEWNDFSHIIENEALTLHALMMSSNPSYILIKPQTLEWIEQVRLWKSQGHKVSFSLDAGANLHILFPRINSEIIQRKIDELAKQVSVDILKDEVGDGPKQILF